jgi:hypothetical protein
MRWWRAVALRSDSIISESDACVNTVAFWVITHRLSESRPPRLLAVLGKVSPLCTPSKGSQSQPLTKSRRSLQDVGHHPGRVSIVARRLGQPHTGRVLGFSESTPLSLGSQVRFPILVSDGSSEGFPGSGPSPDSHCQRKAGARSFVGIDARQSPPLDLGSVSLRIDGICEFLPKIGQIGGLLLWGFYGIIANQGALLARRRLPGARLAPVG